MSVETVAEGDLCRGWVEGVVFAGGIRIGKIFDRTPVLKSARRTNLDDGRGILTQRNMGKSLLLVGESGAGFQIQVDDPRGLAHLERVEPNGGQARRNFVVSPGNRGANSGDKLQRRGEGYQAGQGQSRCSIANAGNRLPAARRLVLALQLDRRYGQTSGRDGRQI